MKAVGCPIGAGVRVRAASGLVEQRGAWSTGSGCAGGTSSREVALPSTAKAMVSSARQVTVDAGALCKVAWGLSSGGIALQGRIRGSTLVTCGCGTCRRLDELFSLCLCDLGDDQLDALCVITTT